MEEDDEGGDTIESIDADIFSRSKSRSRLRPRWTGGFGPAEEGIRIGFLPASAVVVVVAVGVVYVLGDAFVDAPGPDAIAVLQVSWASKFSFSRNCPCSSCSTCGNSAARIGEQCAIPVVVVFVVVIPVLVLVRVAAVDVVTSISAFLSGHTTCPKVDKEDDVDGDSGNMTTLLRGHGQVTLPPVKMVVEPDSCE